MQSYLFNMSWVASLPPNLRLDQARACVNKFRHVRNMFNHLHDHDNVKLLTRGGQVLNLKSCLGMGERAVSRALLTFRMREALKDIPSFVDS